VRELVGASHGVGCDGRVHVMSLRLLFWSH
jgi:hypothetical protein